MNRALIVLLGTLLAANTLTVAAADPTISWKLLPSPVTAAKSRVERGAVAFQNACAVCHGPGPDRPGTSSLAFKYRGQLPALLEERTDLTRETVLYFIRNGVAMMPQFRKTELNDEQAAEIAAYLSSKRKR